MEIQFNYSGHPDGGKISNFLLEKVRYFCYKIINQNFALSILSVNGVVKLILTFDFPVSQLKLDRHIILSLFQDIFAFRRNHGNNRNVSGVKKEKKVTFIKNMAKRLISW